VGSHERNSRLSDLSRDLPRLAKKNHTVTSPVDPTYNCIAWAACDANRWWWPDQWNIYYWPRTVPREETLKAFELAYRTIGYRTCDHGELESGFDKIAVFVNRTGEPTHAARQLANGKWTSKCGENVDIEHELNAVGGGTYGEAALFMKRHL
jgi:hypothetical protein